MEGAFTADVTIQNEPYPSTQTVTELQKVRISTEGLTRGRQVLQVHV